MRRLLTGMTAMALSTIAYIKFVRPWVLDWGATADERAGELPGDDLVRNPAVQTSRAVTIEATAAEIWPWLIQMGPRPRAGVYTYDWIERLLGIDIENAESILPEYQTLSPGEFFQVGERRDGGLWVRIVEPEQALVLQWEPGNSSWAFVLVPNGEAGTRLISRNRIPGSGLGFWLTMALMEPGSLVMERKMLHGIKERAERHVSHPTGRGRADSRRVS